MSDYQNFLRDDDVEKSNLLGKFVDNKYQISREIIDELIKFNKLVTSYKVDQSTCEAYLNNITFKFIIKFNEREDKKYASLYLIESFTTLGEKQSLETFLASYCENNDNEFFSKLKETFNLYTKDESEGKDIKNSSAIIEKLLQEKQNYSKNIVIQVNELNKNYIKDVIKILKKSGSYGLLIQKLLKKEMSKINVDKQDPKYWTLLKQQLDLILFKNYDKCPEETRKWLEQVNQQYVLIYMEHSKKAKIIKKKEQENSKQAKKTKKKEADGPDEKKDKKKKSKEKSADKPKKTSKVEQSNQKSNITEKEKAFFSDLPRFKTLNDSITSIFNKYVIGAEKTSVAEKHINVQFDIKPPTKDDELIL